MSSLRFDPQHSHTTIIPHSQDECTGGARPVAMSENDVVRPESFRRAKWRRNLQRGIVPSLAVITAFHCTQTVTSSLAGNLSAAVGLSLVGAVNLGLACGLCCYACKLPSSETVGWTASFCVAAKWWIAGSAAVGLGMPIFTGAPSSVILSYEIATGVYAAFGVVMTAVGHLPTVLRFNSAAIIDREAGVLR